MNADLDYARRTAQRLNALLDERGGPFDLFGRSSLVAEMLNSTAEEARHLLSGKVPWTWSQIARACQVFEKTPGFFLDEHPVPGLPTDVKVVQGSDGGESIVWRGPRGFTKQGVPDDARLRYMTVHYDGGPYQLGSLLLYAEHTFSPSSLRRGFAYVIESESGLEPMRCTSVHDHVASFESMRPGGMTHVVQYSDGLEPEGRLSVPRIVGNIFACITPLP